MFSGMALMIILPGLMGELGIKPRHSPLLTLLRPGTAHIVQKESVGQFLYLSGGYAEIQPQTVTVLADTVLRADELDFERAQRAREKAQKILARGAIGIDYAKAKAELSTAYAQLITIEKLRKR